MQHIEHPCGLHLHQTARQLLPHPFGDQRIDLAGAHHALHQHLRLGRHLEVDEARWASFSHKAAAITTARAQLDAQWLKPAQLTQPELVEVFGVSGISASVSATDLLRRPEGSTAILTRLGLIDAALDPVIAEQVEIQVKYAGYIERQQVEIERQQRYEDAVLPVHFDYAAVTGLSNEVRAKLIGHRPDTVGQAGRIAGVTPAAVSLLLIHLKKQGGLQRSA